MSGASASPFRFRDLILDVESGLVIKAGKPLAVRNKLFEILAFLAQNPNRVISKDELVQAVWGGAAVSDDALTQTISQARKCIGDENRDIICTVSKRGFFFAGDIQLASRAEIEPDPKRRPIVTAPKEGDPLGGVGSQVATGSASIEDNGTAADRSQCASPPRLSIIVLPFENLTGDPGQEYFVDGVTESLTTDLSHPAGMVVIGRNTAFTYKGKAVDLRQIGRELGVRYVLEGSVQRCGDRMRVNVQLVDAETGNHLWAERFDKTVADLFEMQDEIVAHVANALATQITETEARRAQRALNPDAMDLYFQGMAWFNRGPCMEHLSKARDCFARALALDPDNVWALVGVARVNVTVAGVFYPSDRAERIAAAETSVTKALSLAPDYSIAHLCRGQTRILTRQPDHAIAAFERAVSLNRNLAHAQAHIGFAKVFVGQADEAERHIREALRLSPRDTFAYVWFAFLGYAKFTLGLDEEAIVWLRGATAGDRIYPTAHFWLAAALAHCGRLDEAQSAARAGLDISPTFTISRFRATTPSDNPTFLSNRERFYDGLRKAGVPEG